MTGSPPDPGSGPSPRRRRRRYAGTHPRRFDERYKERDPDKYPDIDAHLRAQGRTPAGTHVPIMVAEVLAALRPAPGEIVADLTVGYGGHALAFLERTAPDGRLIGLELDGPQLEATGRRLAQVVEDRQRLVCPDCRIVFYDNPVPVAAAVVLNERRHVLLVKRNRDPHKGRWCLPMGFAESGETIAEAAVRELKEEAGIDGRVLRLLDADSLPGSMFGDVLIVTFELRKTGGNEQPGDDADEVRYFPLSEYPPLPFSSNEKAVRICAQTHLEGWAIQDSFVSLQGNEDRAMLSDPLVALVEERSEEIVGPWLAEVRSSPTTCSYQALDPAQLAQQAATSVSQLGHWLKGHEATDEVKEFYRSIGLRRRTEDFKLHEIISALTLLKKHIWSFAHAQIAQQRPIDVYRELELARRIAIFFDKANYQIARGFEADAAPPS